MTLENDLLTLATDIAREAGALALRRRTEGVAIAASKSSLADIVTEADREVEELIKARISAERPDDAFFGEESGAADGTSGIRWVVDPIDGTVNYAYGMPSYGVSIAVVEGGTSLETWDALAGAIVAPALGEEFTAVRGGGAFLGKQHLTVSDVSAAGALLATGFGYDPETHAGDLERLTRIMPLARDIRGIGAACLELAYTAAGRLDGYYERGLKPWDYAAGALMVVEAGGIVTRSMLDTERPMMVSGSAALVEQIFARLDARV